MESIVASGDCDELLWVRRGLKYSLTEGEKGKSTLSPASARTSFAATTSTFDGTALTLSLTAFIFSLTTPTLSLVTPFRVSTELTARQGRALMLSMKEETVI